MRYDFGSKVKRIIAGLVAACLLLTLVNVSSEPGIMPCGDFVEENTEDD